MKKRSFHERRRIFAAALAIILALAMIISIALPFASFANTLLPYSIDAYSCVGGEING